MYHILARSNIAGKLVETDHPKHATLAEAMEFGKGFFKVLNWSVGKLSGDQMVPQIAEQKPRKDSFED